jgi:hypothetical protein
MVSRVPDAIVHARRRPAQQKAQTKGSPPAQAHLTRLAWHRLMTHVPPSLWTTDPIGTVDPVRWPIALMVQSWQSARHVAALTTKQAAPTFGSLDGRLRRMRLTYARCPPRRAPLWMKQTRELRLRKLRRHLQAFAARWMQAIFQSALVLPRVLVRVCATAERLVVKASSKRRTTAHILQDRLCQQHEAVGLTEAVNA